MKRSFYILFLVVAGLIGAVLRGMSIAYGLEWGTGLPVAGYLPSLLLKVLCVVVIVLAIVFSRLCYHQQDRESYERVFDHAGYGARLLCGACGIAMAVIGAAALLNVGSMVAEQTSEYHPFGVMALAALVVQWILCVCSGLAAAVFAWRQDGRAATKGQGMLIALPMFWACLDLIMAYHENSSNPVMQDYAYELLLAIALMAAFYYMAGFFFAEAHAERVALFSGLAVFLMLVCDGGLVLSTLMDVSMLTETLTAVQSGLFRLAVYLFVGLYLLIQLTQLGRVDRVRSAKQKN